MAKIKYKVDTKGVLSASADVQVRGTLHKVSVKAAALERREDEPYAAWAQVTFDLFAEKEKVQNGASKEGTVK